MTASSAPTCPTGRVRYRTSMHAAVVAEERDRKGRVKKTWSWCEQCRGYHLPTKGTTTQ